jgi:hypothetical protein
LRTPKLIAIRLQLLARLCVAGPYRDKRRPPHTLVRLALFARAFHLPRRRVWGVEAAQNQRYRANGTHEWYLETVDN